MQCRQARRGRRPSWEGMLEKDRTVELLDERILLEMRIARHHDVVADVVVHQSLKCAVLV
jgi:hypothetical protein